MTTHREAIRKAFRVISRCGIRTRMSFSCCSSCGHYELAAKGYEKFVFWNRQSDASFKYDRDRWSRSKGERTEELEDSLYLQWEGELSDAELIVTALRDAGLSVEWKGTIGDCIEVLPAPVAEVA